MTATLRFNLDDPDDRRAHQRAVMADSLALIIWGYTNNSWRGVEHKIEGGELQDPMAVMEEMRKAMTDLLEENSINIDNLVE